MASQTNTVNLNTYKAKLLSNTFGANNSPIYFDDGVPTILTTIGGQYEPVWVNNGVITAITAGTTAQFYRGDKSWSNTLTGAIEAPILKLHQGTAANPSLTGNARIEFDYTGGQPVVISYTPQDGYRAPAGLKVMGGASATPAWFEVEGELITGMRQVTSGPSSITYANRLTIVPYFHTGGPWYIKSGDDASNAYLALYYSSTQLMRIKHDGTQMVDWKGNANTATKLQTAREIYVALGTTRDANSKVTFDGSADKAIHVSGTLGTARGGTGQTSYTANRLVWTESATKFTAGYHYASSTKVGICYTSEPSYNFAVSGTSYLGGNTTLEGSSTISRAGKSINWNQANTYAILRMTSQSGWSPLWALKANTGWWTMGHYNTSGYNDHLLFTFLADVDVSGVTNAKNHMDYTVRLIPTVYATNTTTTTDRAFVTAPWASSKAAVGGTNGPIYINDSGVATACTTYANASVASATKATQDGDGKTISSTYAKLAGATFTGNVFVTTASGDHYFEVKCTDTGVRLELDNSGSTNHGLWSSGYWSGSAYTASSSWMIYRNASGTTIVNGNCTGSSGSCSGNAANVTGTVTVAHGGTGATSFTANSVIMSGSTTTAALTTRAIYTLSAVGDSGWSTSANRTKIPDMSFMAYWNGAYSGNSSNITKVGTISNGTWQGTAVGVGYGGTGKASWTKGGIVYASATNTLAQIADGSADKVLRATASATYSWLSYTSAATASTIVYRDGSKNFSAGTITATLSGNASSATRIKDNLSAASSNVNRNIWVSSTSGADGIPNYCSNFYYNPSSATLGIASGGRLYANGGSLYLGNSNNAGWVLTQDICSHTGSGDTYWSARADGTGHFKAVYGAVWNDYAEMRNVPEVQKDIIKIYDEKGLKERDYPNAGNCVSEVGNGEMALTTRRLQKGCKIISDTFGFCIGETEDCQTPIAVTGRVLAYPLESLEECSMHIGDFICSGPNGTISIMTTEEAIQYPESIVGTISEIPTYDIWHCGNKDTKPIQVNGRIWIYVR